MNDQSSKHTFDEAPSDTDEGIGDIPTSKRFKNAMISKDNIEK
jgi:hypothetical protein